MARATAAKVESALCENRPSPIGFQRTSPQDFVRGYLDPGVKGEYAAPILRNREAIQEQRYLTDAFGDEAVAFLERQRRGTPFFLYLAFNAVHTPIQATGKYLERFEKIENKQRRMYAAMLNAVDDAVGRVTAKLGEIGQLNRTLVLFSSDNGGPTTRNAVNCSRNTSGSE